MTTAPAAIALIDGEHYPAVVRDALAGLDYEVVGAVLLGGGEKLREGADYGVPLHESLERALDVTAADVVVDLSDDPVLDPAARFRLASRALAAGLVYVGADFRFEPVRFAPFELPALAVIGTGKRVGKTAVAGHVARLLARSRDVVVVAMGRGGPARPVVLEGPPTLDDLLTLSRAGEHAASDYLEDAALARVPTVGCRRCGGGLAGAVFVSNVEAGARLAAARSPDLVVFEGSAGTIPAIEAGARILVAAGHQDPDLVTGYLGAYRILLSDLVVVTLSDASRASAGADDRLRAAIASVAPDLPVVGVTLVPRPVEPVGGRRVAFFSTAPAAAHERLRRHLAEEHGADVVLVSGNLARRAQLRLDLDSPAARSAEVYLAEIKAAAIDVVAETAAARRVPVVFAANELRTPPGQEALDDHVRELADAAAKVPA